MDQQDFRKKEEICTLNREPLLRHVLAETRTLKEENSERRDQLVYPKKNDVWTYRQKD